MPIGDEELDWLDGVDVGDYAYGMCQVVGVLTVGVLIVGVGVVFVCLFAVCRPPRCLTSSFHPTTKTRLFQVFGGSWGPIERAR